MIETILLLLLLLLLLRLLPREEKRVLRIVNQITNLLIAIRLDIQ